MIWKIIGDSTNTGRGITWLWGRPHYGLELAWSHRHFWFIGWTNREDKKRGW